MPAVLRAVGQPDDGAGQPIERLRALLNPAFLAEVGWDVEREVLDPPPQHPTLGYRVCAVTGCQTITSRRSGLCYSCASCWRSSSGLDWAVFVTIAPARKQRIEEESLCALLGCPRPATTSTIGLCNVHHKQRTATRFRKLAFEAFLAHSEVRPLPSLGACRVASCDRQAGHRLGLCPAHRKRWVRHQRQRPDADLADWRPRQSPVSPGPTVVLRGLPMLVQLELLYGLQQRCRRDIKTELASLRALGDLLRATGVASVVELDASSGSNKDVRVLIRAVKATAACAVTSPEAERDKDAWDMAVFGLGGTLDFTGISQSWLRAATKDWAFEDLPTRRGQRPQDPLRIYVAAAAELSASLRTHRVDHGEVPARLGRDDIVAFTNRLAHLEATGEISTDQRRRCCQRAGRLLRDLRALGLTRPGAPAAGLPDDFTLRPGDVPERPDPDDAGRAIPEEVVGQLIAALPQLEARSSWEVRVAVRLLMDTGRRPDEVCRLAWDCLDRGVDGKHVLRWTNRKANRERRLPIAEATAALVREQQQAVRARFPDTPLGELALLPRRLANPRDTQPIGVATVGVPHREWVDALGPLRTADGTEFDKALVVPRHYRNSYAQRHADAGTPVDVLRDLMDHRSMDTTQGYYRVTEQRTRAAVDKLVAYQFDGRGERIWQQAERLLDHEHQRLRVGQVAVPYGVCTEPSNVQAGGGACPFRFRCAGCSHFRTDPSSLPELRGYLDRLLADRERVRAAVELEDWARAEAMPSDAEIGRIRALIRKIEQTVEDLTEEEQQLVAEATRTLRATRRTVHLGMPTVGPPDPDLVEVTS